MSNIYIPQDWYKEYLQNNITPHQSWEIEIQLSIPPVSNFWWVTINPQLNDKRESIFYHRKEWSSIFTYSINRENPKWHSPWDLVIISNTSWVYKYIQDETTSIFSHYKESETSIKILWWMVMIRNSLLNILDTSTSTLSLINNSTNYIYLNSEWTYIIEQEEQPYEPSLILIKIITKDWFWNITNIQEWYRNVKFFWTTWAEWEQGPMWPKWDIGLTWPQGEQWPIGPQWPQWIQGETGATGATGLTWPKGDKWDKWDKWDTWDIWPIWPKGDKWDTGDTWPQGIQGVQGETWPAWADWKTITSVTSNKVGKTTTVTVDWDFTWAPEVFEIEDGVDWGWAWDMLKSIYDPANWERQVAFSDEIPDTSNFETTTQLNARDTANRARANHTWTQLANTISDFQTTVSSNIDVDANTVARHTHANKALLDTYTNTNADISDAISKEHTHANKAILDATTASYTTAEASKLNWIETWAEVNVNADWNSSSWDSQILNKPTIPTATSQLTNDSWFITSAPVDSVNGRTGAVTWLAEANAVVDLSTAQMVWGQKEFTMLTDNDLWTTGWTVAINWNNWLNQKITLNANTTFTFANPRQWHVHEILLTQHSTARTVTFPTVTWANGTAPDLSVASGQYLIQLTYRGTTYFWASISFNA